MRVQSWFGAIGRRAAAVLVMGVLGIPLIDVREPFAFPCYNRITILIGQESCVENYCPYTEGRGHREGVCFSSGFTGEGKECDNTPQHVQWEHFYIYDEDCVSTICTNHPPLDPDKIACSIDRLEVSLSATIFTCVGQLSGGLCAVN